MGYERVLERSPTCPEDLSRPESVSPSVCPSVHVHSSLELGYRRGIPVTLRPSQYCKVEVTPAHTDMAS